MIKCFFVLGNVVPKNHGYNSSYLLCSTVLSKSNSRKKIEESCEAINSQDDLLVSSRVEIDRDLVSCELMHERREKKREREGEEKKREGVINGYDISNDENCHCLFQSISAQAPFGMNSRETFTKLQLIKQSQPFDVSLFLNQKFI